MNLSGTQPRAGRVFYVPIVLAFVGYPFLWLLGFAGIVWPLAAVLALLLMFRRPGPPIALPWPMFIWLAFMGWVLVSAFGIENADRLLAFTYRGIMYASATILFFYVYNMPRHLLPDRVVVSSLAWLWVAVAIGGLIGVVRPEFEIVTLVERLLPAGLLSNGLVYNLVHAEFATVSRFHGYPVGRPEALFPYTNAWGSNFALLLPMAFASWRTSSARWRPWAMSLVILSVVPVILSLNRGLWLTTFIGLAYAVVRFAIAGRVRSIVGLLATAVVAGVTVVGLGLGGLVTDRAETGHSDDGRLSLYQQSVALALESPLVGYGAPQPNEEDPSDPSVGTHGQFWLVLVSQGFPGAILYVTFTGAVLWSTRRWDDDLGIWSQTVLVIAASQILIYEQLPTQLQITMVVSAMAFRALRPTPIDAADTTALARQSQVGVMT